MSGALTANTIDARTGPLVGTADPVAVADVSMLSPVDGASTVVLTGIAMYTEVDEEVEITFQWYRCALGVTVDDDTLGVAVGDPFTVMTADTELGAGPVTIMAIDRATLSASAYALAITGDPVDLVEVEVVYADAVLYD